MALKVRVSLPTYNALTDNDPRHYSLFADSDNILIKEKARGSGNLASGATATIAHNLGYVPHVKCFGKQTSGTTTNNALLLAGQSEGLMLVECWMDDTNLYIKKIANGQTGSYQYYIFYDQQAP